MRLPEIQKTISLLGESSVRSFNSKVPNEIPVEKRKPIEVIPNPKSEVYPTAKLQ